MDLTPVRGVGGGMDPIKSLQDIQDAVDRVKRAQEELGFSQITIDRFRCINMDIANPVRQKAEMQVEENRKTLGQVTAEVVAALADLLPKDA